MIYIFHHQSVNYQFMLNGYNTNNLLCHLCYALDSFMIFTFNYHIWIPIWQNWSICQWICHTDQIWIKLFIKVSIVHVSFITSYMFHNWSVMSYMSSYMISKERVFKVWDYFDHLIDHTTSHSVMWVITDQLHHMRVHIR